MANKTSPHILSTSANLLGFCLFVITSLHIANKTNNTILDEATSAIALLLALSSIFSFASIRTENKQREHMLELIADGLFLLSLVGILSVLIYVIVNVNGIGW